MSHCKNCQSRLEGAYCNSCGQRDVDLERPIWSLVGDILKEAFELDGRSALTVRALFLHPGRLTHEFLAGRRRSYTSPLRLYLAISILFFIVAAWGARSGYLLEPGQDPRFDAAIQAGFLADDLPRLMFLLLPVFALLMKIVYFSRLYFDHLIFSIHLHTAGYVILAVLLPLEEVTPLKKGAEPETNRLNLMMRHPLARRFVAGVRGVDIARWRDQRLHKVTPATVKRDLVLLGHVFEVARKEWGIYVHNPVRDIKLPPGGRPRDRRLQPGEETRLFDACREARNHWLLPMVQLAIETAMRQGELLRLRWEHIDLNRRTAHLPDTKNGESRTVPLSSTSKKNSSPSDSSSLRTRAEPLELDHARERDRAIADEPVEVVALRQADERVRADHPRGEPGDDPHGGALGTRRTGSGFRVDRAHVQLNREGHQCAVSE